MATHLSFDHELIGEMMAGVRRHYKGLFAFGIDHVVVNVTKDRIWVREAALPETTNIARPDTQWMIEQNFGGVVPGEMTVKNPVAATQEQSIRDLEIDPARFTPADQMRPWARTAADEITLNPAQMIGVPPSATRKPGNPA